MKKRIDDHELQTRIQEVARIDGFLISNRGTIAWTPDGLSKMRRRFSLAGIDIRKLRTLREYLHARQAIEPGFQSYLAGLARGRGQLTDERRLLMAIVDGDASRANQLRLKLQNRKDATETSTQNK